jgi:hypothetical protein
VTEPELRKLVNGYAIEAPMTADDCRVIYGEIKVLMPAGFGVEVYVDEKGNEGVMHVSVWAGDPFARVTIDKPY